MYDELIKALRTCSDQSKWCEDCVYYEKCCKNKEHFSVEEQAADAIEELQQYADLYKDLTEKSQKVATELKQQLQKSEEDNVNLTGWLAEEHAKQCPHYIRNVHDRGDDSLCDKWMCEVASLPKWIPVTERLPDDGAEVLAFSISGFAYVDWRIDGKWKVNSMVDGKYEFVTHWMPLPEPPKEET